MALARVKNWVYEKLTYSDLNAEFNNILNNPGSLITPVTFHLTFTDATYDIGASGATRPRDLFLSRNATIGGTLGVTGLLTPSAGVKGTTTNDSASALNVGEYVESVVAVTNCPTTSEWGDLTSISLTAGDWDVSVAALATLNAATITGETRIGISTTTGNSATGLVTGSNRITIPAPTATSDSGGAISSYRESLAGTTTVYLKYFAEYTGGPPKMAGRISARRVR